MTTNYYLTKGAMKRTLQPKGAKATPKKKQKDVPRNPITGKPSSKRKHPLGYRLKQQAAREKRAGEKANPGYIPFKAPVNKENRFWEAISTYGRNPKFATPEELLDACKQYFTWVDDNPYLEYKVAGTSYGEVITTQVPKLRPYTVGTLCMFLSIAHDTWINYRTNNLFLGVVKEVEWAIREQKFGGAAAGFFNTNIICRDLGLIDRKDTTTDGQAINQSVTLKVTTGMSVKEAEQLYKELLSKGKEK